MTLRFCGVEQNLPGTSPMPTNQAFAEALFRHSQIPGSTKRASVLDAEGASAEPMQAFKTKAFARWADGEGLADKALAAAVAEMDRGLVDARPGGEVVKKRVALPGRGQRGSTRTLVAIRRREKAFFVYGFSKNERANISDKELRALKLLAK